MVMRAWTHGFCHNFRGHECQVEDMSVQMAMRRYRYNPASCIRLTVIKNED